MAWVCIRKAMDEEIAEVERRAKRFAEYHHYPKVFLDETYHSMLHRFLEYVFREDDVPQSVRRHGVADRQLWHRIIRRLTSEPRAQGIIDGYVGYHRRDA